MQATRHASSTGSMLVDVNGPRNIEVTGSVWSSGPAPWWGWWVPRDAAEHMESGGCWSAVFTMPITRTRTQAPTYCLSLAVTWLIVEGPHGAIYRPLMFSLIHCRSVVLLWFMSESCSPWCCRMRTLTRESDWLFVLSIIREYIQFTPFITPGPRDKWWGGLF